MRQVQLVELEVLFIENHLSYRAVLQKFKWSIQFLKKAKDEILEGLSEIQPFLDHLVQKSIDSRELLTFYLYTDTLEANKNLSIYSLCGIEENEVESEDEDCMTLEVEEDSLSLLPHFDN